MHEDHFFVVKIRPLEALSAGQTMPGRHGKHLPGFDDEFVIQFGEGYRRTQKADIQLAGVQSVQLLGGGQGKQRELHTGELHAKAAEDSCEPGVGHGRYYADAQVTHEPVFGFLGPPFSLGRGGKDRAGLLEEDPAGVGQMNGSGGPLEQLYPQFGFQSFDLGTQGGLRDVEQFRGTPETQRLSHGYKVTQMSQFHGLILLPYQ
jgi:hypothetical protein